MDEFKPLELEDKRLFTEYFAADPPGISELTFTNLFVWRHRYHPVWMEWEDCLLILFEPESEEPFGLQPVGGGDKQKALAYLVEHIAQRTAEPRICRVSEGFVKHCVDPARYNIQLDRDNSDYVYLADDLTRLAGRRYHRKKNHVNKFMKAYAFEYRKLDTELVECFLDMQEDWCQLRKCQEDSGLLLEDYAVHQALTHFEELDYQGGAVILDNRVEAFALGEPLTADTAVIHMEKANPDVPGLYAAVNQLFCANAWSRMQFINREQDLGVEGLRKAKESYHPHHMVHKYTLTPSNFFLDEPQTHANRR